jgi:hypothetical protein
MRTKTPGKKSKQENKSKWLSRPLPQTGAASAVVAPQPGTGTSTPASGHFVQLACPVRNWARRRIAWQAA